MCLSKLKNKVQKLKLKRKTKSKLQKKQMKRQKRKKKLRIKKLTKLTKRTRRRTKVKMMPPALPNKRQKQTTRIVPKQLNKRNSKIIMKL